MFLRNDDNFKFEEQNCITWRGKNYREWVESEQAVTMQITVQTHPSAAKSYNLVHCSKSACWTVGGDKEKQCRMLNDSQMNEAHMRLVGKEKYTARLFGDPVNMTTAAECKRQTKNITKMCHVQLLLSGQKRAVTIATILSVSGKVLCQSEELQGDDKSCQTACLQAG